MAENLNKRVTLPRIIECQDTVTRVSGNTTQYTAGDAISDNATTPTTAGYFTLDFATVKGGSVMLTDFTLHKSDHDVTAATFWLFLFDALPVLTGFEDNVALGITDAEMKNVKGCVTFAAADWQNATLGDIQTVSKTIGIVFADGSSTLYGVLVAGDTYTPADGEVFTLTVHAVQD